MEEETITFESAEAGPAAEKTPAEKEASDAGDGATDGSAPALSRGLDG